MRRALLAATAVLSLTASARADLQFCNKTSYVLDLALALEEKDAAATRGWLRVDPGACRTVLQGAITGREGLRACAGARRLRALAAAAGRPRGLLRRRRQLRHRGREGLPDPLRASGSRASRRSSRLKPSRGSPPSCARKPTTIPRRRGLPASSACWSIAGYDANPIDGLEGKKTTRRARSVPQGPPPAGRRSQRPDVLPGDARRREGGRRRRLLVVQRDAVSR